MPSVELFSSKSKLNDKISRKNILCVFPLADRENRCNFRRESTLVSETLSGNCSLGKGKKTASQEL